MKVYYENEHGTLWHGDCLKVMEWLPIEYGNGWADMVLCDPPYGTTQNKWDSVIPLDRMWSGVLDNARQNAAVVMTAAQPFTSTLGASRVRDLKYSWVWEKSGCENVQEHTGYPRTIQAFKSEGKTVHPTQKPVALFAYLISTYTNLGETVLDFCAGSGTTAVAAESTGRKWVLVEKEEKYCETIAKRLGAKNN